MANFSKITIGSAQVAFLLNKEGFRDIVKYKEQKECICRYALFIYTHSILSSNFMYDNLQFKIYQSPCLLLKYIVANCAQF